MRAAMAAAEVGDDVFGEDPTVNRLEERMAALFGHEAGLFCPSGTMTNQIAVHVHTRPGDEVICDEGAHIYRYEGGGVMATSGCSVKLINGDHGRFTADQVIGSINDRNADWLARTRLVNVENTCNRGGGAVWDLKEVDRIRSVCDAHDLALHLDGARIFNAMAVTGERAQDWGARFDSLSICLSKGLGAPAGSVLVGDQEFIRQARRVRKRLGGGMRQAGILAQACLFALDHHVQRLADDHVRAATLATALEQLPFVTAMMPVRTNIIIFSVAPSVPVQHVLDRLLQRGVRAVRFGPDQIRMVTHLDITDADVDHTVQVLQQIVPTHA